MQYWEKLKDPRWQKKRLEVLERFGFTCFDCKDQSTTLHVHHGYYERGLDPWEYPDDTLFCLCENCHGKLQELLTECHRSLGKLWPEEVKLLSNFLSELAGNIPPTRLGVLMNASSEALMASQMFDEATELAEVAGK